MDDTNDKDNETTQLNFMIDYINLLRKHHIIGKIYTFKIIDGDVLRKQLDVMHEVDNYCVRLKGE